MNEMRGRHTHDGHGGLGEPTTPSDPEHPENADNEKAEQGKRGKHEREAGKTRMASPQTAQEEATSTGQGSTPYPLTCVDRCVCVCGVFATGK